MKWSPIKNFDNRYFISENGTIKSLYGNKEKFLQPKKTHSGYLFVTVSYNQKYYSLYIHKEVAKAFIPNPENKTQVNHINGNKTDNRIENLEWVTSKQNIAHAWLTKLVKRPHTFLSNEQAKEVKKLVSTGVKQVEVAKMFNVDVTTVYNIVKGKKRFAA